MGQTVELEVSGTAIEPGTAVTVANTSTEIAPARRRQAIVLSNGSDEEIWCRLDDDGAVVGEGTLVPAGGVVALRGYGGALCAICTSGGKSLGVTEY